MGRSCCFPLGFKLCVWMYVRRWFVSINVMLKVIRKTTRGWDLWNCRQNPSSFKNLSLFDQNHKNTLKYQVYIIETTFNFGDFISIDVGVIFLTSSMCPWFTCTGVVGLATQCIQGNKVKYFPSSSEFLSMLSMGREKIGELFMSFCSLQFSWTWPLPFD